ncbi:MAG TPA: serine hydrolase domain-containing protein, partial [Symbiobacteriaceae bacterium]|nr:serine hydrolase domain-containing protein [Symbiobacteriaceae bacterium]
MSTRLARLLAVLAGLAVAFFPASAARAGAPAADRLSRLDQYLTTHVKAAGLPGASAAVVYRDQTLFLKGYGVRDLKSGEPVTPETVYPTGSNGKSFTGTAILQLVEQGKVKLDDPVKEYIPWFELARPGEADRITIRHLLSHTSGLRRNADTVVWQDPQRIRPSLEEGVRALRTERLWSEPWARYEYSNMNYVVLGRVVEVASGLSFGAYVQRYTLDPLGMQQTSLGGS